MTIRDSARRHGLISLRQAGLLKVIEGVATLAEILRVTPDEASALAYANDQQP